MSPRSSAVGRAVTGWLLGLVTTAALAGTAYANWTCENIGGNTIVVGEARYETLSGAADDVAYANSYWGGSSHELTNDVGSGDYIGGTQSSASNLAFYAYAYHEDSTTSDHTNVTFSLRLERSSEQNQLCPSYLEADTTDTLVINSSVSANLFYAGRLLGRSGMGYQYNWRATVTTDSDEADDSDSGCFTVLNQNSCDLVDY